VRWLQGVDLFNRPAINRAQASTNATAIVANGAVQSTGIGTQLLQPKRYAEFTIKARITFNINSVGPAYVYRASHARSDSSEWCGSERGRCHCRRRCLSRWAHRERSQPVGRVLFHRHRPRCHEAYRYYLSVKGPNTNVLNLVNSLADFVVMERS
jgi:hypothetical protein